MGTKMVLQFRYSPVKVFRVRYGFRAQLYIFVNISLLFYFIKFLSVLFYCNVQRFWHVSTSYRRPPRYTQVGWTWIMPECNVYCVLCNDKGGSMCVVMSSMSVMKLTEYGGVLYTDNGASRYISISVVIACWGHCAPI